MGDLVKQIALILILLSSILITFTFIIDEISLYIDTLTIFYPAVDIYTKYHIITLLTGLFIYALYEENTKDKCLLMISSVMMLTSFLIKEFSTLHSFNILDLLLRLTYTSFLSIYIWQSSAFKEKIERNIKINSISMIFVYSIFYSIILMFFEGSLINTQDVNIHFLGSIIYIIFHYGIYLYFRRIYGLTFNHTFEVNLKD